MVSAKWHEPDILLRVSRIKAASGLPSNFVRKRLLLLRGGYVRELAAASYPHIQCGVAVIFLALQVAGAVVGG